MKNEFVPYEQALELKELGFNEPCLSAYFVFGDGKLRNGSYGQTQSELFINGIGKQIGDREIELKMYAYHVVSTPTFSQAFRWFRENYDMQAWFSHGGYIGLTCFQITSYKQSTIFYELSSPMLVYEEAELDCLKKLIELTKTK